ncbi:MAG: agmatinase family protein [Chloroflexi bacterium]|nr:agmatinase family protein [Chloroflexota bacterium]
MQSPYPGMAGITTFLGLPEGDVEHLKEGMVAIAGVSYDLSCTSRIGARYGPRAIRDSSRYYTGAFERSDLVEITTGGRMKMSSRLKILDLGDLNVYPLDWPRSEASLRDSMYQMALTGATPVILGGDHFITYPLVQGYADAIKEKSGRGIGYIQFSSRLDLGDEDPVWGRVWRGATARRILDSGAVSPSNMVWVGVNGYLPSEDWEMAQERELSVFTLKDVRERGILEVAEQAAEIAGEGCQAIYVSVDFDVLDGAYVPTTGSTGFDGLTNVELLKVMDLFQRTKVGALDLTGLNPTVNMVSATGQRFGAWLVIRYLSGSALAYP